MKLHHIYHQVYHTQSSLPCPFLTCLYIQWTMQIFPGIHSFEFVICGSPKPSSISRINTIHRLALRGGSSGITEDWKVKLARLESENEALRQENQILAASRQVKTCAQKTMHSFFYRKSDFNDVDVADGDVAQTATQNSGHASCNDESLSFQSSDSESHPTTQVSKDTIQSIMEETDRLFNHATARRPAASARSHNPHIADADHELLQMRATAGPPDWPKLSGCRIAPGSGAGIAAALHRGRRRLVLLEGIHRLPRALRVASDTAFYGAVISAGRAAPAPAAGAPRVAGRWALAGGTGALSSEARSSCDWYWLDASAASRAAALPPG